MTGRQGKRWAAALAAMVMTAAWGGGMVCAAESAGMEKTGTAQEGYDFWELLRLGGTAGEAGLFYASVPGSGALVGTGGHHGADHSVWNEEGFYVGNGAVDNALTKNGLWVGGYDNDTGFHVGGDGQVTVNGGDAFQSYFKLGKVVDDRDGKEYDRILMGNGNNQIYVNGDVIALSHGSTHISEEDPMIYFSISHDENNDWAAGIFYDDALENPNYVTAGVAVTKEEALLAYKDKADIKVTEDGAQIIAGHTTEDICLDRSEIWAHPNYLLFRHGDSSLWMDDDGTWVTGSFAVDSEEFKSRFYVGKDSKGYDYARMGAGNNHIYVDENMIRLTRDTDKESPSPEDPHVYVGVEYGSAALIYDEDLETESDIKMVTSAVAVQEDRAIMAYKDVADIMVDAHGAQIIAGNTFDPNEYDRSEIWVHPDAVFLYHHNNGIEINEDGTWVTGKFYAPDLVIGDEHTASFAEAGLVPGTMTTAGEPGTGLPIEPGDAEISGTSLGSGAEIRSNAYYAGTTSSATGGMALGGKIAALASAHEVTASADGAVAILGTVKAGSMVEDRQVSADGSIAIGSGSEVSVLIKDKSSAKYGHANGSVALGEEAKVVAENDGDASGSTALGRWATIYNSSYSTAVGNRSGVAGAHHGMALGAGALVDGASYSTALGALSTVRADDLQDSELAGVISVGSSGAYPFTRRIINVSDPILESDAATMGWVSRTFATPSYVDSRVSDVKNYVEGRVSNIKTWASDTFETKTAGAAVSAEESAAVSEKAAAPPAEAGTMAAAPRLASLSLRSTVSPSMTADDEGGRNHNTETGGNTVIMSKNPELESLNVTGKAELQDTTVAGTLTVHHGEETYDVGSTLAAHGSAISSLGGTVHRLGNEVDSVGALSAALAGLHPLDDGSGDKLQLAAALGTYDGTQAAALGGFYWVNEDLRLSVGLSTAFGDERKTAANMGAAFRIGPGKSPRSRAALAEELAAVKAENEAQKEKIESMEEKLEALEAAVAALTADK